MRRFFSLAVLVVMGAGLLAGCGGQLTAPEIIQHLKDTAANTQDLHMVVSLNADLSKVSTGAAGAAASPDSSMLPLGNLPKNPQATIELWYKQPNQMRADVQSMTPGDFSGATVLNDGTTLW